MTDFEKLRQYIEQRIDLISRCNNDASDKIQAATFGIEFELRNILNMMSKFENETDT